jgi:hypothetical protein
VDFGNQDVSRFKDAHDMIHLDEDENGKFSIIEYALPNDRKSLCFDDAVKALKLGYKVRRKNWREGRHLQCAVNGYIERDFPRKFYDADEEHNPYLWDCAIQDFSARDWEVV